jgi:hypothetical protein
MSNIKPEHAAIIAQSTVTFDATYSAEDNKLRLYACVDRLEADLYNVLKEHGFSYAPKQELFVTPRWTPTKEDLCLLLADEITAEQTTLVERAEVKAARLDQYAENALHKSNAFFQTADQISQRFAAGQPILIGHHSEGKARRDQDRMHNAMSNASEAASKVNYWNYRATGVEHHANSKANPRTRFNRIKKLLEEFRNIQRDLNHYHLVLQKWQEVKAYETSEPERFKAMVYKLITSYLKTGPAAPSSYYGKLTNNEMTHCEIADKCIEMYAKASNSHHSSRWICHILNRWAYESLQLSVPGLFDGELTATIIQAFARIHGAHAPKAKQIDGNWVLSSVVPLPVHIGGVKTLVLTDDKWRELMRDCFYDIPATKPKQQPILNFKAHSITTSFGHYPQQEALHKLK